MIKNLKLNLLSYLSSNLVLIIYSLLGTMIMTTTLQNQERTLLIIESVIYGFLLGLPFCLGSDYLLKEKINSKIQALGTAALFTIGFCFSYFLGDITEAKTHLLATGYLLFLLAPKEIRTQRDLGFHWIITILAALGKSFSISMTLLLLLSFLTWVIKELFNIELPSILNNIGLSFFSVFLPINIFGMLKPKPQDIHTLRYRISYSIENAIRVLFTPVLLLYIFILLCYVAKITLTWTLPNGMISQPIAIAFSLYFILSTYIESQHKQPIGIWRYRHILNFCFIPLFVTMFIGISVRIQTYGFTTDRVYLLLIFLLMCASLLVQFVFRTFDLRKMIVIAATILLATSSGPLSPIGLTVKSQIHRFLKIVRAHGSSFQSLEDLKLDQWSQEDINHATSGLNQIFVHKKESQLIQKAKDLGVLSTEFNLDINNLRSRLVQLESSTFKNSDRNKKCYSFNSLKEKPIEITGYNYIQAFSTSSNQRLVIPNTEDILKISTQDKTVYLVQKEKELILLKFGESLEKYAIAYDIEKDQPFTVEIKGSKYKLKLIIQKSDIGCKLENITGHVLIAFQPS